MAPFRDAIVDAVRNAFCELLEFEEGYLQFISQTPQGAFARIPLAAIRFASRMICNREPPDGLSPPFDGGQCQAQYLVVVNFSVKEPGGGTCNTVPFPGALSGTFWGPIESVTLIQPGTIPFGQGPCTGQSGFNDLVVRAHSTNGGFYNPNIVQTSLFFSGIFNLASIDNITVTRVDGQPDECGNPLPTPPAPQPPPDPMPLPVPYDDADGNTIVLGLGIIFAPVRVNINGTLSIPFRISIDPDFNFQFNGDLNINSGNVNINFKNPGYSPSPSPIPDDYDTPDNIPDYPPTVPNSISPPSPDNPPDETEPVIRACIVTVSSVSNSLTIIGQDVNPDIYIPDLGIVQFAIATDSAVAWTSDIRVKNLRNFIPCPWDGGALQVRGTPREGVSWTITPVYAKAEDSLVFAD